MISAIITAHNEAEELRRTLHSLAVGTAEPHECVVVDDASTDGCCDGLEFDNLRIMRNQSRRGVAPSRLSAAHHSTGAALAFFDGHQRISKGCVERCAELALQRNCIVSPVVQGFKSTNRRIYGASFRMCPENGFFSADWIMKRPWRRTRQINALRAPGYVIPKSIFDRVCWIDGMRGWGGSEAVVSVKAFFTGVEIVNLRDPIAWHRFKTTFHYDVSWEDIWRNHALIARVCFDERTWYEYWLPEVFEVHLTEEARRDLESDGIIAQHRDFLPHKVRPDRDFWGVLLRQEPPPEIL